MAMSHGLYRSNSKGKTSTDHLLAWESKSNPLIRERKPKSIHRSHDYDCSLPNNHFKAAESNQDIIPPKESCRNPGFGLKEAKCKRKGTSEEEVQRLLRKAAVKVVVWVLCKHARRLLQDDERRHSLRLRCSARLNAEAWAEAQYGEQAIFANLDWGIDGVECLAKEDDGSEASVARLQNAERMLGVAAILDADNVRNHETCGVPNSYIAAWAHLYLALACRIRENDLGCALHLLGTFTTCPTHARLDFAPEVWEQLFLPHFKAAASSVSSAKNIEDDDMVAATEIHLPINRFCNDIADGIASKYAQYYKDWLIYEASTNGRDGFSFSKIEPPNSPVHAGMRREAEDGAGAPEALPPAILCKDGPVPEEIEQLRVEVESAVSSSSVQDVKASSLEGQLKRGSFSQDGVFGFQRHSILCHTNEHGLRTGVCLDGKELTEKELLQVWAKVSGGKGLFSETCSTTQWSDMDGSSVTPRKLSDIAEHGNHLTSRMVTGEEIAYIPSEVCSPTSPLSAIGGISCRESDSEDGVKCLAIMTKQPLDRVSRNVGAIVSPMVLSTSSTGMSHETKPQPEVSKVDCQETAHNKSLRITKPPKEFICPITNLPFENPVTIETGQTYEHKAIEEWLEKGNNICPLTRQILKDLTLPSTNEILKKLVDKWRAKHQSFLSDRLHEDQIVEEGTDLGKEKSERKIKVDEGTATQRNYSMTLLGNWTRGEWCVGLNPKRLPSIRFGQKKDTWNSATSPIVEALVSDLKQAVARLCTADELIQGEEAIQKIHKIWLESRGSPVIEYILSKTAVIHEMMEVLSTSNAEEVLRATVCILSALIMKDEVIRQTVLRIDNDLQITLALLRSGHVPQAAIMLYVLKPPASQVYFPDLISLLVETLRSSQSLTFPLCWTYKSAAVLLLEQQVTAFDQDTNIHNAHDLICLGAVPCLIDRLDSGDSLEEKLSVASTLRCCIQADGSCRRVIAQKIKISSVAQLLQNSQMALKTIAIGLLHELIHLDRRSLIDKLLLKVRKEGFLSSMHVLLAYIQTVPLEHQSEAACLLLQLDLLAEPRRYSVYREEAIDVLVTALHCEGNTPIQIQAAKSLINLRGHFSYSGRPMLEAWLLKKAGLEDDFVQTMKEDQGLWMEESALTWVEEQKMDNDWDARLSGALLANGEPLLEALEKSLSNQSSELVRLCLTILAWLSFALSALPETGIQVTAISLLVPRLVKFLQPHRTIEERVLACFSLYSYIKNSGGYYILEFAKEIYISLRKLKWITWSAKELLLYIEGNCQLQLQSDVFIHEKVASMDARSNGETHALVYGKGQLFTGHEDGSIKVWDTKKQPPKLSQEVKEHNRAVTCLAISESSNNLFSGSLDKTVRVWSFTQKNLRRIHVVELMDIVKTIAPNGPESFIVSQGFGIKVYDELGVKTINGHKQVQSIIKAESIIYCGCTDSTIQEIDLATGQIMYFSSGSSGFIVRKPVHSLQVFKDWLYTAGYAVDGISVKVWNRVDRCLLSTISTGTNVKAMVVNEDFIYLGCRSTIEVWLPGKLQRISTLAVTRKVTSLVMEGGILYSGSEDGIIRAWALR